MSGARLLRYRYPHALPDPAGQPRLSSGAEHWRGGPREAAAPPRGGPIGRASADGF